MSEPTLPTLQDVIDRLDKLEQRLEAPIRFYIQATGVLGVIKWVGVAGMIAIAAFIVNMMR